MSTFHEIDESFTSKFYLAFSLESKCQLKNQKHKEYQNEVFRLEEKTTDCLWISLLAPYWKGEMGVLKFFSEEEFDLVLTQWHRAQEDAKGEDKKNSIRCFPIEFVNVDHFSDKYEEDIRQALEFGNDSIRSAYELRKYENGAASNWNAFYRRNTDKFYKNRHYLLKDFYWLYKELNENKEKQVRIIVHSV